MIVLVKNAAECDRLTERFLSHVDRSGGDDACWPWTASDGGHGYGQFGLNGVPRRASRVAWALFRGPIPPGMFVCHRCDNRACVNWERHLFLGTHTDNMRDMLSKKRSNLGARNRGAKISESAATEIRSRAATGESKRLLAEQFGISRSQAYRISGGKKGGWRHLPAIAH